MITRILPKPFPRRFLPAALCRPLGMLAVGLGMLASTLQAEPYRFVILPDTQNATEKFPEVLDATCDWIAANKEKLNIQYVLQVGDMVERGGDEYMWKNFDGSMKRLEKAGVPYILAVGNHDFSKGPGDRLALFEQYFPVSRFDKLPSFGSNALIGSNSSSYHAFRAGGTNWLVISMIFNPPEYIMDWAGRVIEAHPDHQVILLTHSYLEHKGRDVAGERIWQKIGRKYPNVSMAICGHLSTVNYVDKGDAGNTVYQMLFDWQNPTSAEMNSYCSIIELDPEKRTIAVSTYSAKFDKYLENRTSKFSYQDVNFMLKPPAKTVVIPPMPKPIPAPAAEAPAPAPAAAAAEPVPAK